MEHSSIEEVATTTWSNETGDEIGQVEDLDRQERFWGNGAGRPPGVEDHK